MSENVRDAYPPAPFYIRMSFVRHVIVFTLLFIAFRWVVSVPRFDTNSGYEENVTSSDSAFEVYKLHKTKIPSQSNFGHFSDLFTEVFHFMLYYACRYVPLSLSFLLMSCYCYRIIFMKQRMGAIANFYRIDFELISEINIDREQHLKRQKHEMDEEERVVKSKLLLQSPIVTFKGLRQPDLVLSASLAVSDYTCLQNTYFPTWTKVFFDFADMVVLMRQVLGAVHYLHEKNIYHLDLQPKNVWVRKSMWRFRRHVKIAGFDFAKQNEASRFPFEKVGLQAVFRPPEFVAGAEMNAAKFDSWSLGVIAFEVFTGGMLSVESGLMRPPVSNGQELMQSRGLLKHRYFLSAVQSNWDILENIFNVHLLNYVDITLLHDLYYDEVLADCSKFVRKLLYHDCERRYSVLKALDTPFMRKATKKRRTSKFNVFRYL